MSVIEYFKKEKAFWLLMDIENLSDINDWQERLETDDIDNCCKMYFIHRYVTLDTNDKGTDFTFNIRF